jgi:hypothetical protein
MKDEIIRLIRESVIIQGLITLIVICTVMYMYVRQLYIPQDLINLLNLIVGFWFGSKITGAVLRR